MLIQDPLDPSPSQAARPRLRHILCVDDDPILLEALRLSLGPYQDQWAAHFSSDPSHAIELSHQMAFDLVVADVSMPSMDGISMIEAMREHTPGLRSIVLSGMDRFDVVVDAVNRVGILRYLRKPCTAAALVDAIGAALQPGLESESMHAAFEHMPLAALLVDADGKLLFANTRGAAVLGADSGLLVDVRGRLAAGDAARTRVLRQAIHAAVLGGQDDVLALPRGDRSGAISLALIGWSDGAVIYVHDARSRLVLAPGHLSKLLNLTASEARLAHALATSGSLEDAAGMCGITLSTARTYLKVIFAKTGTRGQPDLMRLLVAQPQLPGHH